MSGRRSASTARRSRSRTSPTPSAPGTSCSCPGSSPSTRRAARRRRRRRRADAPGLREHAGHPRGGGCGFEDVVKVTVFLTDVDDRPLINPVRQEVFGAGAARVHARRGLAARRPRREGRDRVRRPRTVSDDPYNAFVTRVEPAGEPSPAALGRTLAVKDLFDTAGIRTTYGSRLYADHVPERNATPSSACSTRVP